MHDDYAVSAVLLEVSFLMQGGSPCENAPLLRIDTHNVELAAAFAPKPQWLVSAVVADLDRFDASDDEAYLDARRASAEALVAWLGS